MYFCPCVFCSSWYNYFSPIPMNQSVVSSMLFLWIIESHSIKRVSLQAKVLTGKETVEQIFIYLVWMIYQRKYLQTNTTKHKVLPGNFQKVLTKLMCPCLLINYCVCALGVSCYPWTSKLIFGLFFSPNPITRFSKWFFAHL